MIVNGVLNCVKKHGMDEVLDDLVVVAVGEDVTWLDGVCQQVTTLHSQAACLVGDDLEEALIALNEQTVHVVIIDACAEQLDELVGICQEVALLRREIWHMPVVVRCRGALPPQGYSRLIYAGVTHLFPGDVDTALVVQSAVAVGVTSQEKNLRHAQAADDLSGHLAVVGLQQILPFIEQCSLTGCLSVHSSSGHGEVWFEHGVVRHAACGGMQGNEAFDGLIQMKVGTYSFAHMDQLDRSVPETVSGTVSALVLDALRQLDEGNLTSSGFHRAAVNGVKPRREGSSAQLPMPLLQEEEAQRLVWKARPMTTLPTTDNARDVLIWAVLGDEELEQVLSGMRVEHCVAGLGERLHGYVCQTTWRGQQIHLAVSDSWPPDSLIERADAPVAIVYVPRGRLMRLMRAVERSFCEQTVLRAGPRYVVGIVEPASGVMSPDEWNPCVATHGRSEHHIVRERQYTLTPTSLLQSVLKVHA